MTSSALWWIRRDLRLTDNQALAAALHHAASVTPVFILDDRLLHSKYVGPKRTAFLLAGLAALDADLQTRGSRLIVRAGDPAAELARLCAETGATGVYAEEDHSPFATRRDATVAAALAVPLHLTEGLTVRTMRETRKENGEPYTVYTPFSRRWKERGPVQQSDILAAPARIATPAGLTSVPLPQNPSLPADVHFPAGEAEAKRRLSAFAGGEHAPVYDYANQRNSPAVDGTSGLSPYVRFGMLSARLAALAAYTAIERAPDAERRAGAGVWLNELIWREFYVSILHHFPHVRSGSFRPQYDEIQWDNNATLFATWCAGQTGYPIVDAAMRQLSQTGWMHNRTRMVVASFLVKDLLIDWRWGERWFMQQLVDGDPAANNGGWQWTAGTGTDAAPYFRVFNPMAQGQKFDPEGIYVRRWAPELQHVPTQFIHEPWRMPKSEQRKARCTIGADYPSPMVDHAWARTRVLNAYKAAKAPT